MDIAGNSGYYNRDQIKKLARHLTLNKEQTNRILKDAIKANYDNKDYWETVLQDIPLSADFMLNNILDINFSYVIRLQEIPKEVTTNPVFLKNIIDKHLENDLLDTQNLDVLSITYLIKFGHVDNTFWEFVSKKQRLTIDFMDLHSNNIVWEYITEKQSFDVDFLTKHIDKIVWKLLPLNIPFNKQITDETIHNYKEFPIWDYIGILHHISELTLINYIEKINVKSAIMIIKCRTITDTFLDLLVKKFRDEVEFWEVISRMVNLNTDFIDTNKDRLDWKLLSENHEFTEDELRKFKDLIDYEQLSDNMYLTDSWAAVVEESGHKLYLDDGVMEE